MKRIDSVYITRTYGGCLQGIPTYEDRVDSAKNKSKNLWGKRPIFIIEPDLKEKMLPLWVHIAYISNDAISKEAHGSELVVVWWDDSMDGSPDNIYSMVNRVDWNQYAEDFWY